MDRSEAQIHSLHSHGILPYQVRGSMLITKRDEDIYIALGCKFFYFDLEFKKGDQSSEPIYLGDRLV